MRQPQPYPIEQAGEVVTPRNSYHDVAQRVLYDERPANNPGRQLVKRGIGVGRAADRNDSRKLRVAQGQKRAGHGCKHEQQRYGRPTGRTSFPNGAEIPAPIIAATPSPVRSRTVRYRAIDEVFAA
jgi:hypothetical protein